MRNPPPAILACLAPLTLLVPPALAGGCDADLNRDGEVNSSDLNAVLLAFGATPDGDIDGDDDTDSADLNLLLAAFGTGGCGGPAPAPCCAPSGEGGCADALCMDLVCASDESCCTVLWDEACVETALGLCPVCIAGPESCCYPHATPGCIDEPCEAEVCRQVPYCCVEEWDELCAAWAFSLCPGPLCDGIFYGPCCEEHPTAGCDDPVCTELVCKEDPYCCEVYWDHVCEGDAFDLCKQCD